MDFLPQVLLLLGTAVALILLLQRIHVPSTIAYLLTGVILGPFTVGPILDREQLDVAAEYGIVFLLFTIGLSYSLPELRGMRRQLPLLGTGQVVLTLLVVTGVAGLMGIPWVAAFVLGAVFAQSSTTIISKQLAEQGENNSRPGRLGLAMSVFQDVTAVPFVVVIPVIAVSIEAEGLAMDLGWAALKAVAAIAIVLVLGRWILRPLFHLVARLGSAEVFTLTALLVVLAAAWTSGQWGLSLAFGAFLAGMTLGETEFRHQVEATIRPFRDVLLGLFFVAIGMLFDPGSLPDIWPVVLLGTAAILIVKFVVVALLAHLVKMDRLAAVRTGLLLSVGGEFGFALVAIATAAGAIDHRTGQIALTSVLLSMAIGTFVIRYNVKIGSFITNHSPSTATDRDILSMAATEHELRAETAHVVLGGYGRIGQSVAHLLDAEQIPYIAVDLDSRRVREARAADLPVYFGSASNPAILEAIGIARARLVVLAHDDIGENLKTLHFLRTHYPDVPVMVRSRDESRVTDLLAAGATEVVPETLEAGLSIASQTLLLLDVAPDRVLNLVRKQRASRYRLMREFFAGDDDASEIDQPTRGTQEVTVAKDSGFIGSSYAQFDDYDAVVVAVMRDGHRIDASDKTKAREGDIVVAWGTPAEVQAIEREIGDESATSGAAGRKPRS